MAYTLNHKNNSLKINDGEMSARADLKFPGQNFSGYGSSVDQNFLSLAESFASAGNTGPANAIMGQIWYDSANANVDLQGLKVCNVSNMELTTTWQRLVTYTGNTADISVATITANSVTVANGGNLSVGNIAVGNTLKIGGTTSNVLIDGTTGNVTMTGSATITGTVSAGNSVVSGNIIIGGSTTNVTINGSTGNISGGNLAIKSNFSMGVSSNVTTAPLITASEYEDVPNGKAKANSVTVDGYMVVTKDLIVKGSTIVTGASTALTTSDATIKLSTNANSSHTVFAASRGIDMKYGVTGNTKNAFMGLVDTTSSGDDPYFVLLKEADTANAAVAWASGGLGDLTINNITLKDAIIGGTATGNFSGSLSTSNIYNTTSNISISATDTVNISTKANISGNTTIGGNLTVPNIIGANITATANNTISANTVSANYILGTIRTGPQPYITKVGTLSSLTVVGNITAGNINTTGTANFGTINLNAIKTTEITSGGANIAGNVIGKWKLSTGSTFEASYADLAERHHADKPYPVGTVMTVGGDNEITAASVSCRVLGVVSEQYAYLMNEGAGPQDTHPAVAYVGRVPVRVVGPIIKHSPVSPLDDGTAQAGLSNQFGWALETNLDDAEKLVLCLIK
jgi:hypothetical protein